MSATFHQKIIFSSDERVSLLMKTIPNLGKTWLIVLVITLMLLSLRTLSVLEILLETHFNWHRSGSQFGNCFVNIKLFVMLIIFLKRSEKFNVHAWKRLIVTTNQKYKEKSTVDQLVFIIEKFYFHNFEDPMKFNDNNIFITLFCALSLVCQVFLYETENDDIISPE